MKRKQRRAKRGRKRKRRGEKDGDKDAHLEWTNLSYLQQKIQQEKSFYCSKHKETKLPNSVHYLGQPWKALSKFSLFLQFGERGLMDLVVLAAS